MVGKKLLKILGKAICYAELRGLFSHSLSNGFTQCFKYAFLWSLAKVKRARVRNGMYKSINPLPFQHKFHRSKWGKELDKNKYIGL